MNAPTTCSSCQRGIFPDDTYCSWCGTRVGQKSRPDGLTGRTQASQTIRTGERASCHSCHNAVLPGDAFCSSCGAQVGASAGLAEGESSTRIARDVTAATRGKYQVVRELGRGGMGLVFLARDRELHRRVAIKVLSPALLADDAMVQRFMREARIIASLRHESIVAIYDVGQAGDLRYFVMDYIDGVSLSQVLRTHGPLPLPVVETVLYQVGQALAYVHRSSRGLVHRDVKPANVMLDPEGLAVLMDFGISKADGSGGGITRTGMVMGTPEYMSPEQCRGLIATPESDQYALGAVAYAMLTGRPPFTGPFYQVLMAHQNEKVEPLQNIRPDCPPELASGIERMLAKLPAQRWPSLSEGLRSMGLRPLSPDDPLRGEIARLVSGGGREPEGGREGDPDAAPAPDPESATVVTGIEIEPPVAAFHPGDVHPFRATALFKNGEPAVGTPIAWHSTNPSVVRVDPNTGEMEAVGVGQAVVVATSGGFSESLPVEVLPTPVHSVMIEPELIELKVGERLSFRGTPRSVLGDALEGELEWSSSNPRVLEISRNGMAMASEPGQARVIATCGDAEGMALVRVQPADVPAARPIPPPPPVQAPAPVQAEAPPVDPVAVSRAAVGQRRRRRVAVPVILVLALVGGLGWFLSQGPSSGESPGAPEMGNVDAGIAAASPVGVEGGEPGAEGVTPGGAPPAAADGGGARLSETPPPVAVEESPPAAPSAVAASGPPPVTRTPEPAGGPPPAPAVAEAVAAPPVAPDEPAMGRLEINVLPWAHVFINGDPRGEFQNRLELDVPAGVHQIRLMNPNFQPFDTTVVVEGGGTTVVVRAMQGGGSP